MKIGYVTCIKGHTKRFRALTHNKLRQKMNDWLDNAHLHPEVK